MSDASMNEPVSLRKHAKGARPQFFPDPAADRLMAMLMALAGEVAVLRSRNDTLERLLEERGVVTRDEIEGFTPDKDVLAERDAWHEEYLGRVLRILDFDDADLSNNDTSDAWQDVIDLTHQ